MDKKISRHCTTETIVKIVARPNIIIHFVKDPGLVRTHVDGMKDGMKDSMNKSTVNTRGTITGERERDNIRECNTGFPQSLASASRPNKNKCLPHPNRADKRYVCCMLHVPFRLNINYRWTQDSSKKQTKGIWTSVTPTRLLSPWHSTNLRAAFLGQWRC